MDYLALIVMASKSFSSTTSVASYAKSSSLKRDKRKKKGHKRGVRTQTFITKPLPVS